jgi:hypothetical protein
MEKIKAWFKNTWAKRPWLLGLMAGGLVAAGYWIYTKVAGSSTASAGTSDATGVVSVPQTSDSGAGSGTDTSNTDEISSLADAIQQSQQANTDVLTQALSANEASNSSFFSSVQQQLDALAGLVTSIPSMSQQVTPIPAAVSIPTTPSPVVNGSTAVPTVPAYAAPAVAVINQGAASGLLSTAAVKNMIAAVTATPVPVGTPTGSDIKTPVGAIQYPTGVSVAQGMAMATAFASTPLATKSTVLAAPKAPTTAPIKKIVGRTVVSA